MPLLPFQGYTPPAEGSSPVPNPDLEEIPEEFEIFYKDERDFLPEGKSFEDLTKEELEQLRRQYRFSALKPGIYQGVTGFSSMMQ
jgi:hypothetical protein